MNKPMPLATGPTQTELVIDKLLSLSLGDLPRQAIDVAINDLIDMAGNCLSHHPP